MDSSHARTHARRYPHGRSEERRGKSIVLLFGWRLGKGGATFFLLRRAIRKEIALLRRRLTPSPIILRSQFFPLLLSSPRLFVYKRSMEQVTLRGGRMEGEKTLLCQQFAALLFPFFPLFNLIGRNFPLPLSTLPPPFPIFSHRLLP